MPRFSGTPVEQTSSKPRFSGKPVDGAPTTSTLEDVLRSIPAGAASLLSGTLSMGDAVPPVALARHAASWFAGKEEAPQGNPLQQAVSVATGGNAPKASSLVSDALSGATDGATDYQPQTTAGGLMKTAVEMAPQLAMPGGMLKNLPQFLGSTVGSEGAAELAHKYWPAAEPYARIVGALLGGAAPKAGAKLVTPNPAAPEVTAAAKTLADEGVPLTAGQKTGSESLRYAESAAGGVKAAADQGAAFTRAALKRANIDADRMTPEVLETANARISGEFDRLAGKHELQPDKTLISDLRDTFNSYGQLVPESARVPLVENLTRDVVEASKRGNISGEAYQSFTSRLERAARGATDPELKMTLRDMRASLDDAMERTLSKTAPDDVGAWKQARRDYKNFLVIEQAATGASEGAARGYLSPMALRAATLQKYGRRAYSQGKTDFDDLSRAGEAVMKPMPNSGTANRLSAASLGATGLAGALGASQGNLTTGLVSAALTAGLPMARRAALTSRPGQAYLANQLLPGGALRIDPKEAILQALLASPDARR